MTRDEIIRMAMDAGMSVIGATSGLYDNSIASGKIESLVRFAKQAHEAGAKAEREECAKVCEEHVWAEDIDWWCTATKRKISALRNNVWNT